VDILPRTGLQVGQSSPNPLCLRFYTSGRLKLLSINNFTLRFTSSTIIHENCWHTFLILPPNTPLCSPVPRLLLYTSCLPPEAGSRQIASVNQQGKSFGEIVYIFTAVRNCLYNRDTNLGRGIYVSRSVFLTPARILRRSISTNMKASPLTPFPYRTNIFDSSPSSVEICESKPDQIRGGLDDRV
jgi:hypothetical protein